MSMSVYAVNAFERNKATNEINGSQAGIHMNFIKEDVYNLCSQR